MKVSILHLRYKMKEVLKALESNEIIQILHHGKLKGTILPAKKESKKNMEDHPFFGMHRDEENSVEEKMRELRGDRYALNTPH